MRHSQFLEQYLDGNAERIREGRLPITIGTFLTQNLKGRAKDYWKGYSDSLMRSCMDVGAVEVPSAGGGTAYVRKEAK